MAPRVTPGKLLRRRLDAALAEAKGRWSPREEAVVLPAIERMADDIAALESRLAAERAKPEASLREVQLQTEHRQLTGALDTTVRNLMAPVEAAQAAQHGGPPAVVKSPQHVEAGRKSGAARRAKRIDDQRAALRSV